MSVRIMAQVFDLPDMGPTKRIIMLALADHADDAGRCYPSVDRLAKRTGLSERAVRTNLRQLESEGYLGTQIGVGPQGCNVYIVRTTPAADAPRQEMPPGRSRPRGGHMTPHTPAADAPEPSRTTKEPSEYKDAREIEAVLSRCASPASVASFVKYRRKQKGKALSLTAAKRLAANLQAIFDAGGDPDDALGMAEERGWQSIQPDWYFRARGQHGNASHEQSRPDAGSHRPGAGTVAAFAAVAARLEREQATRRAGGHGSDGPREYDLDHGSGCRTA